MAQEAVALPRCPSASPAPALGAADRREAWHAQGWGCFMGMLGSHWQNSNVVSPRACPCPPPTLCTAVRSEHDQHWEGQAWILSLHSTGEQHGFLTAPRCAPLTQCRRADVLRAPRDAQGPTRHPESHGPALPPTSTLPWPQPPLQDTLHQVRGKALP